jgi:hypothetical protein
MASACESDPDGCGDSSKGCIACALAGNCKAAQDACAAEPQCPALDQCDGKCNMMADPAACIMACATMNPKGVDPLNTLLGCVLCQECLTACATTTMGACTMK